MSEDSSKKKKVHRTPQAGVKADKKKKRDLRKKGADNDPTQHRNLKGFSFKSAVRAQLTQQRNSDREHRKHHVPQVNRQEIEGQDPPPVVIAVAGPKGVGKSTLIKGLVKHYTRQPLTGDIQGPITVVSGKNRRLTFVECGSDLFSMIDMAKTADLLLLVVDASFGFEMETFEMLNIAQIHGFPKVMGVLTHLDKFRSAKTVRQIKTTMKHRFWTEIYDGAKMFYLSGIKYGKYPKNEIMNLARFLSIMKFRPLQWRNQHSYIISDRIEDITDPSLVQEDFTINRNVSFYGFVRGTNLKMSQKVHLLGVGDFDIENITELADPCPLPEKNEKTKKRRGLSEKQKVLYAPMANVGDLLYDADAVYINLRSNHVNFTKPELIVMDNDSSEKGLSQNIQISSSNFEGGDGERMVKELQDVQEGIDTKLEDSQVRLFKFSKPIRSEDVDKNSSRRAAPSSMSENIEVEQTSDVDEDIDGIISQSGPDINTSIEVENESAESGSEEEEDHEDSENDQNDEERPVWSDDDQQENIEINSGNDDSESENDSVDEDAAEEESEKNYHNIKWKDSMVESFKHLQTKRVNLMDLVYGTQNSTNDAEQEDSGEEDEDFFRVRQPQKHEMSKNQVDSSKVLNISGMVRHVHDWEDFQEREVIRNRFVTGDWSEENATGMDEIEGRDTDVDGSQSENSDSEDDQINNDLATESSTGDALLEAKKKKKEQFNQDYDTEKDGTKDYYEMVKEQMSEQEAMNNSAFAHLDARSRLLHEGAKPGQYVRIELSGVPCEFIQNFNPRYPIILGALLPNEHNLGFIQMRFKRHRWHPKILKNRDPLIFSIGWRRFQSIPVYSIVDQNSRNRMLKYTPEHMHCMATIYGPVTPINTGVIAFQSHSSSKASFRVSGTGTITELDESFRIVKKLKLTGYPVEVHRNTAFIRDMFSSSLEASKFEGATIRTVSGIRGQIKKALTAPGTEGRVRCTFEDKILRSDIVFCRTWTTVELVKFYNPVTSLLLTEKENWQGMRGVTQLRREKNVPVPHKKDSEYRAINRPAKLFNPLIVPSKLQAELPFSSKSKDAPKRRRPLLEERRKVALSSSERKAVSVLNQVHLLRNEKLEKRKLAEKEKRIQRQKELDKAEKESAAARRSKRKEAFAKEARMGKKPRNST